MQSKYWFYLGAAILILIALTSAYRVLRGPEENLITAKVERGNVREIVSVSGLIKSDNTANLAFPVTGVVEKVYVNEGDVVLKDDLLVTLIRSGLYSDRQDALADLQVAEANRAELIAGPSGEERDVTEWSVVSAKAELERMTVEEAEKVKNAKRLLYSSDLEAFPTNKSAQSDAPSVTGTYICENSGEYELEMYPSGGPSGYSYSLSGLETGLSGAYTSNPTPLGECGLKIQFTEDGRFGNTDWKIPVPNINGASYATNLNAYELALKNQDNVIAAAEDALESAIKNATLQNATPRDEALVRANATVLQAAARLNAVDAEIADRMMRAPFPGTVSSVDVRPGETVGTTPIVSLLSNEKFQLTARIPEIDIAKIKLGQKVEVVFDAAKDFTLLAEIIFISPSATEIDGVGYFEAKLEFFDPPPWLRSGLNADANILIEERTDTLRLPRRFLGFEDKEYFVLLREGKEVIKQKMDIGFTGNDGFVEIIGLKEGDEVIAP